MHPNTTTPSTTTTDEPTQDHLATAADLTRDVAPSMQGITNAAISIDTTTDIAPHIERAFRSSECRTPLVVVASDIDPMPSLVTLAKRQGSGIWSIVTDSKKSERNAIDYVDVGIKNGDWVVLTEVEKASSAVLRHIGLQLMTLQPDPRVYPRRAFFRLWIVAAEPFDVNDWIVPFLPQVLLQNALVARSAVSPDSPIRMKPHRVTPKYDPRDDVVMEGHVGEGSSPAGHQQPHMEQSPYAFHPPGTGTATATGTGTATGTEIPPNSSATAAAVLASMPPAMREVYLSTDANGHQQHDLPHLSAIQTVMSTPSRTEMGTGAGAGVISPRTSERAKHKLQRRFPSEPPLILEEIERRRRRKHAGRESDSESDRENPEQKLTGLWFHRAVDFYTADTTSEVSKSTEGIFPAMDQEDVSAVKQAALSGHLDLDNVRRDGMNPLMWAVSRERTQSARVLLQCGANVHVLRDRDQCPLLFMALEKPELLEVLLNGGADVNVRYQGYRLEDHPATHPLIAQLVRKIRAPPPAQAQTQTQTQAQAQAQQHLQLRSS